MLLTEKGVCGHGSGWGGGGGGGGEGGEGSVERAGLGASELNKVHL